MSAPLVCTNNTQGHIDYGVPIVANKSTDYRTAYKTYHQHIPNKAQEFDARVKVRLLKEHLQSDWNIKEVNYDTNYNSAYFTKITGSDPSDFAPKSLPFVATRYFRTEQERYYKNPPAPNVPALSEMKKNFHDYVITPEYREVWPPEPYAKCEVKSLGRDEQPPVRPQNKGYYKWLDPYLTVNRSTHINFPPEDRSGIGEKDIITFYVGKGYNPVNAPPVEPLIPSRKGPVFDKVLFKTGIPNNIVRKTIPRIPNFGMESTYQGDYIKQSFSDMSPYTFQNGEEFRDSLPGSSPWQTLCPPAMYCTEYCHIGTGWPVRSVVPPCEDKREIIHKPCNTKFCDWSK